MASNQDVFVKIIAQDGASAVFHKVGAAAQTSGNQMSQSAQKASRDWVGASRQIGVALGAVSALAVKANNASEQSQARLKASIEATGKSYDQYAAQIKKASDAAVKMAFDDEDAADAISTLTQATGDAQRAINDLSLAEDVARARKIDLAAAANIVAAAEEGRYGALARIGIQIDANATKEEALGAIQQKVAGQAKAYAETNAATWDRYKIEAENALETLGSKLAGHEAEILAVTAAWTAFGGAITSAGAALGITGAGLVAIAPELAAVGVLLAAGYYAYTHPDERSQFTDAMLGRGHVAPMTEPGWQSRPPTAAELQANNNAGPVLYWDYGPNGPRPFGGTGHEERMGGQGQPLTPPVAPEFGPNQDRRFDSARSRMAAGNYPMASDTQSTAQLQQQYSGYANIAVGALSAAHALEAFNTAQEHIQSVESKYSGQLSDYSGQLNALQAAYDEVNAKKESGATLTERETKFLDGYTSANERLTGGVYDATLALGEQAEQYANNMTAADEFKSATGDMTDAVNDLIQALYGIPGYVKATVDTEVNDGGAYNLGSYLTWLNGQEFRTRWVNETVNITTGQVAGPSVDAMANGGTIPFAANGFTSSGQYVNVGEHGPEMVWLPGGAQVTNAVATQSRRAREGIRGGDIHYHIHGGIHVSANSPSEFATALGHVRR